MKFVILLASVVFSAAAFANQPSNLLFPGFKAAECRSSDPSSDVRIRFQIVDPRNPAINAWPIYRVQVAQTRPARANLEFVVASDIIGGDPSRLMSRFSDKAQRFFLDYRGDFGGPNAEARVLSFDLRVLDPSNQRVADLHTREVECRTAP